MAADSHEPGVRHDQDPIAGAHGLRAAGRFADALAAYQDILTWMPGRADAYNGSGIALIGLRRMEEAVTAFRAAIAAMPNYPEAFNNLGNALVECGQGSAAVEAFRSAIGLRPD